MTPNSLLSAIKDNGTFFESASKHSSNLPNHLKVQAAQIQQVLNHSQQASSTLNGLLQNSTTAPSQQNSQHDLTKTATKNTASNSFNAIRSALLERIQTGNNLSSNVTSNSPIQTTGITHTSPNTTHSIQTSSPVGTLLNELLTSMNKGTNTPIEVNALNDLKGLLLSITAALKTDSTTQKNTAYVEALAQLDLLKNPFNFPHFANAAASLASASKSAESLLADQQFTTGQLLKLIAGMLNRIQFNQLNSLYQSHTNTNDSNNLQSWFFELPVSNPNHQLSTFEVRIDKEDNAHKQEEDDDSAQEVQWKLALAFTFEELGTIYVQVTLTPPVVSSTIWADNPSTLALINREKPHFQSKLAELGLQVDEISCRSGQPKQDKTRLNRSLVDIKA